MTTQKELTWGDVFAEVENTRTLTTEETVNCLFAAFADMVAELADSGKILKAA